MHANSSNLTLIRDAATPAWPAEPYTGGPEGTSESDPVGVAPVLAKRSRPSMYIVDAIPALSAAPKGSVGRFRGRLLSADSALLGVGVEQVQTDVLSDGARLRSKRGASIVQPTSADDV